MLGTTEVSLSEVIIKGKVNVIKPLEGRLAEAESVSTCIHSQNPPTSMLRHCPLNLGPYIEFVHCKKNCQYLSQPLQSEITLELNYEAPHGLGRKTVRRREVGKGSTSGGAGREKVSEESSSEAEDVERGGGNDDSSRDSTSLDDQEGQAHHQSSSSGSGR